MSKHISTYNVKDVDEERMKRRMEAFDDGSGSEDASESGGDSDTEIVNQRAKNRIETFDEMRNDDEGTGDKHDQYDESDDEDDEDEDDASQVSAESKESGRKDKPQLINKHTAVIGTNTSRDPTLPLSQRLKIFQGEEEDAASSMMHHTSSRLSARKAMKKRRAVERASNGGLDINKELVTKAESGEKTGRKHKNAPAEMASNKPVRRYRDNLIDHNAKRKKAVDPRFNDMNGKLSDKEFYNNYNFLNDYQESEIKKLAKAMKKTKGNDKKQHLKGEINARKQNLSERKRAMDLQQRISSMRQTEKEKVAAGKKPFFMKVRTFLP